MGKTANKKTPPPKPANKKTPPKKNAPKAPPPSPGAEGPAAPASNAFTDFGQVREVPFRLLQANGNYRKILDKDQAESLNESVAAGKAQKRMIAYETDDGHFEIEDGASRFRALQKAGFPPDDLIEIEVKPAPQNLSEAATRAFKTQLSAPWEWPDKARAIGQVVGIVDETGRLRSDAEIEELRAKGQILTQQEAARQLGLKRDIVGHYVRAAMAPYDDLVLLHGAGGGLAHGEAYAKYPDNKKAAALSHFLQHRAFPVDEPPPRLRAPATTPTPAAGAPILGRAPEHAASGDKRRPQSREGGTQWDGGGASTPPSPTPAPIASADRQVSMFANAPPPTAAPLPRGPSAPPVAPGPRDERLEELCDHFGISLELARLFDAVREHWHLGPVAEWEESQFEALGPEIERYREDGPNQTGDI